MTVLDHVKQMKGMAEILTEYSFPSVSPVDEEAISLLKQRIVTIDGYEITLYYSKCNYKNDIVLKTVQVYSRTMTYLPFRLLCKIAKIFFGSEEPGYIDMSDSKLYGTPDSRQVYIWTVYYDKNGIIPFEKNPIFSDLFRCEFEGFVYYKVNRKNDDLIFF